MVQLKSDNFYSDIVFFSFWKKINFAHKSTETRTLLGQIKDNVIMCQSSTLRLYTIYINRAKIAAAIKIRSSTREGIPESPWRNKSERMKVRAWTLFAEMRGISSSRTNSYYDSEVKEREREEGKEKERQRKRARIVFCFVRRVGGHHDDRVEHKRGAPEGVTGHKILRSPFYAGV